MSEIERVQPAPPAVVTRTDTDSWVEVMRPVILLAEKIASTEFVPKNLRNNVAATTAAILYGREVGLPPMTSLTQTHVIEGKPAMSAEAMRAMVFAAGHQIVIDQTTGAQCTMRGRRTGTEEWTTITWTIDMARAAGVASKQVWKSYPRQMLQARATTELVRLVFPDVIHGFRSTEELDVVDGVLVPDADGSATPAPGTTVQRARRTTKKAVAAPKPPVDLGDAPPLPDEEPQNVPSAEGEPSPAKPTHPASGGAAAEGTPDDDGEDRGAESPAVVSGEAVASTPAASPQPDPSSAPDAPTSVEPDPVPSASGASEPASAEEAPKPPGRASKAQLRMLYAQLKTLEVKDEWRHALASKLLGRKVTSFTDLSKDDVSVLINTVRRFKNRAELDAFMAALAQPALVEDVPSEPVVNRATPSAEVEPPLPEEPPADEDGAYDVEVVEDGDDQ